MEGNQPTRNSSISPSETLLFKRYSIFGTRWLLCQSIVIVAHSPAYLALGTAQLPPCFRVPLRLSREPDHPPKTTLDNLAPSVNTSTPITLTSFTSWNLDCATRPPLCLGALSQ